MRSFIHRLYLLELREKLELNILVAESLIAVSEGTSLNDTLTLIESLKTGLAAVLARVELNDLLLSAAKCT